MEFIIRQAHEKDMPGIMGIMEEAAADKSHSDWFVTDHEDYIRAHLEKNGFIIVAEEAATGETAGFFVVNYPSDEENLGSYLEFSEEKLRSTALMDSAAVAARYRGHRLQARMLAAAEAGIDREKYNCLLCTVHPQNRYSLDNMLQGGYQIQKKVRCYGGLSRYILMKEL